MPESIVFETSFEYATNRTGITVPVEISLSNKTAVFAAKIDTGSTFCVFARKFGEEIGIEIENGLPERIITANGDFLTYAHRVTMIVLGYDFDILVYFAESPDFQINVLGRYGFLMQIKFGLIEYDGKISISPYNS